MKERATGTSKRGVGLVGALLTSLALLGKARPKQSLRGTRLAVANFRSSRSRNTVKPMLGGPMWKKNGDETSTRSIPVGGTNLQREIDGRLADCRRAPPFTSGSSIVCRSQQRVVCACAKPVVDVGAATVAA